MRDFLVRHENHENLARLNIMKRRDFLGVAALGAGAAAMGQLEAATQDVTTKERSTDPAAWIQLTKDVKCSRLGFGTGMRGGNRVSDTVRAGWPKSIELLQFAYDHGIRFFDCADMYGSHVIVAEAMKGRPRDSYTLGTKLWLHPNGGIPEKERLSPEDTLPRLLRELKTDYIDLVQIHCMMNDKWTGQFEAAMESLARLKEKGVIRAHGISSHSVAATELAANTPWCDVVHVRVNSEGMNMDGGNDNESKIRETLRTTKLAHDAGKGIIAMKIVGEGKMADQPAMRKKSTEFVTHLDCVDVMIVGFTEKEHVTEFVDNVAATLKK